MPLFLGAFPCLASEDPPEPKTPSALLLAPLLVPDRSETDASGLTRFEGPLLEKMPAGNRTLTDVLQSASGVQIEELSDSGLTGGEILPARISISGARFHENDFRMDGMGMNGLMSPASSDSLAIHDIPGHAMALFPDLDLLESLTVYSHDIPAAYGGFTGGVVSARTRNPKETFSAWAGWRGTRNEWTSFHIPWELQKDLQASPATPYQPRFEKNEVRAGFETPLSQNQALLFSVKRLKSTFPVAHLSTKDTQTRTADHVFGKLVHRPDSRKTFEVLFQATPYEAENFIPSARESRFTYRGGGMKGQVSATVEGTSGVLRAHAGHMRAENERKAPSLWRKWEYGPATEWGREGDLDSSREGGYGDFFRQQDSSSLHLGFSTHRQERGPWGISFDTGLSLDHHTLREKRPETVWVYTASRKVLDLVCADGALDCIPGDQFFYRRTVYTPYDVEVEQWDLAAHLGSEIHWNNVVVRPGLRLQFPDSQDSPALSPRIFATWHPVQNQDFRLRAGAARYQGGDAIYLRLREKRGSVYYMEHRGLEQGRPGAWTLYSQDVRHYRYRNLALPYSDEWTLGADLPLMGGILAATWVERRTRNQITAGEALTEESGFRVTRYTNEGSSDYKAFHLSWQRAWKRHEIMARLSFEENISATSSYNDEAPSAPEERYVFFQGRFQDKNQLPRMDYARPWSADLLHTLDTFAGIRISTRARYRAAYKIRTDTGEEKELPQELAGVDVHGYPLRASVPVLREETLKSYLRFDSGLHWQIPLAKGLSLELSAEVLNVFNHAIFTGPARIPLTGRQLWLGAGLRY
jgi:hypothetical protein